MPLMKRTGRGAIVNTASVAAMTGPGGMSAYAASKHGIHGLTRVAAMENAAHNIRVNTLAPGFTETPMVIANSAQNPAFAAMAKTAIPAKRGGQPGELAAADLATDLAMLDVVLGDREHRAGPHVPDCELGRVRARVTGRRDRAPVDRAARRRGACGR